MSNNPYNQNQGYSGGQTQDDGYQKVGGGDGVKRERWRFEDQGRHVFEGILLRKNLNVVGKFGTSNFYTVVSAVDNVEYNISGTKLLDDRMAAVMAGSFIKIIYLGVHREKAYKMFDVFVNKNYQPTGMVGGQQQPVNNVPNSVYQGVNPGGYTPPQAPAPYTPPPSQYPQPAPQPQQQGQQQGQQGYYNPPAPPAQQQTTPSQNPFPSVTPFASQAAGMGQAVPQAAPPSPSTPFPNNTGVAPSGEGYTNPPF